MEKSKKLTKKKKIIFAAAAGTLLGIGAAYGIYKYGNAQYNQGYDDAEDGFQKWNYERIRHDSVQNEWDKIFKRVDDDAKLTVHAPNGNKIYLVGNNQSLDFIKDLVKGQPEIKNNIRLILEAPENAELKSF